VDTVHRLFVSPHSGRTTAKRFKGYIDAKVPRKENSKMKDNSDAHFYNARVKYVMQMSAIYEEQCAIFSVDNKNKVKIGEDVLAGDRRTKIRRFYPTNDRPIYSDHDFPARAGNLITPSGYMLLRIPNPPELTADEYGRIEYHVHRSGPVAIVNRGPLTKCTAASHTNDLLPLVKAEIQRGKTVVSIIGDGGSDFNT
ncbi:uncharacterized protein LOC117104521, partial [Anneissia japonica]|uniref:uncharacterized protein LOC117104521 n=1 Tax=Anneissia japonica TaxID=1529436 RepID=UPI001425A382